jgi:hypothetical protein
MQNDASRQREVSNDESEWNQNQQEPHYCLSTVAIGDWPDQAVNESARLRCQLWLDTRATRRDALHSQF